MSTNGAELVFAASTLCRGEAAGPLLALDEPLSFWGGTDLKTGLIIDAHHPQHGTSLGGTVLLMDASRGSSSSSSVLAEQLRAGVGPAAIVLSSRDAILCLGVLAATELYGNHTPVVLLDPADAAALRAQLPPGPARVSVRATPGGIAAVVLFLPAPSQGHP
ncbi:MAG: DUF126 domain-containing protein [Specibacter sp.]